MSSNDAHPIILYYLKNVINRLTNCIINKYLCFQQNSCVNLHIRKLINFAMHVSRERKKSYTEVNGINWLDRFNFRVGELKMPVAVPSGF